MKKLISMGLVLAVLLTLLPATVLADGWEGSAWAARDENYAGWTLEDGKISGVFSEMYSNWLRNVCIEDIQNFVLEVDITGSKESSPYIKILNNVIDLNGHGGTGNQVYVKVADQGQKWMDAQGTRVHVKVLRVNGGEMQVKLTGAGNDAAQIYNAPVRSKDATVEIGLYRGVVTVENFSVGAPDADDIAEFEIPKVEPPDPDTYNHNVVDILIDQPFDFKGNGAWNAQTAWTWGSNAQEGIWLQSDSADGPNAGAVYMQEKLGDQWLANCAVTPISTENEGVTVAQLRLLRKDKADLVTVNVEYTKAAGTWKFAVQERQDEGWVTLWESEALVLEDTTCNFRLDRIVGGELKLTVVGDRGYTASATVTVADETIKDISYFGVLAMKSVVRFTNFRVGATQIIRDYAELARETYRNLMKNYLDSERNRLYPVTWGFHNGQVTNTGKTASFEGAGSVWEHTVMLMALDTYAQSLEQGSEEYLTAARIITNTVKMLTDYYPENMITTAAVTPNWAMDDTGWTTMCLLLGYYYNKVLGNEEDSALCYRYAKKLFHSAYDTFYNADLGGLCYTEEKTGLDLYAATLALAGYYINLIQPDEKVQSQFEDIYNGLETLLRRPDGLYWMGVNENGAGSADNPYGIREGGSCTYIGGNMAMAVLNMLLGNEEKAYETVLGITRFESYNNGAFMNDRDAWNNTFFLGMFVREVMGKSIADGHTDRALYATVTMILENACFDDGYYGASWSGPKEPSSLGYPSQGEYSTEGRNHWGVQVNNNGLNIGSTPQQIMTSATTAHVLLAAALNQKYDNTDASLVGLSVERQAIWPVFNPDITDYAIGGTLTDAVTVRLDVAPNALVSVNGEALTGNTFMSRGGTVEIKVTSGDGKTTKTYQLNLGNELPQPKAEFKLDTNTVLTLVLVAVVLAAAVVILVELKKTKKN
ncbi:MAG: cadherin-like beta sandwich domain-containing protein [Ruminococcaceae bacterium]|nr:cadherin-like beta sandwich domain-containing protein [Oscillospiraceae bacterium]